MLTMRTTSPVCGALIILPSPTYMPTWPGPVGLGLPEDEVARLQILRRDARALEVLPRRVVVERDAELAVDVHHQPGAVEAAGRRGAAPDVRDAEVALRDRDCLGAEHAAVRARARRWRRPSSASAAVRRGAPRAGSLPSATSVLLVIHMRVACTSQRPALAPRTRAAASPGAACAAAARARPERRGGG